MRRRRVMTGSLGLGLSLLVMLAVPAAAHSATTIKVSAAATSLPQSRLEFGLANQPSDLGWMTSSGVPWRYRYQYLAGGVNTGAGWETWNSPTGAFATFYMNASSSNGYIPVFSYYELLQSSPSTGANESDRDNNNLNNASTMAAYYGNFKLLMQLAGSYGKPVVVHVEPDLWGYLQQRAGGGDASTLSASVASSGFAEAAGLPNTAQGFAWELLKLRDTYAANALLAIHASEWASGIDVATNTSSSVNAVSIADSTAAFLQSAGGAANPYASTWDLVFNDVDDHDAAWWESQGADNAYSTHWWDPTNTKFPNFGRYLAWVAELHAKTAKPQVVWQVPVGNQYFLTMNNTCGHYQDNVAPYFISHASALFSAGLIAVLFGAGNGCQTNNTDVKGDGVTNNGGVTTSDLLGYCSACNNHSSVWPDDDGGYLRLFVGEYYSGTWTSLGGALTSGPDASSRGPNELDVFMLGAGGGLWHTSWNGTTWTQSSSLGGVLTSDPGAVSWSANRIDVFARGQNNGLWHMWWNGSAWSGWYPLGGGLTSGPDVASWGSARLDVFVKGQDNGLWHISWNGTSWSAWQSLGGVLTSDPTAVSWGRNRIDVFARGQDNGLWHLSWNGTSWSAWQSLGGTLTSGPDASSCAPGHLDVFALGSGSSLVHEGFTGSGWTGWTNLGNTWASDPGAVCRTGGIAADVFERGTDNALWEAGIIGS